MQIPSRRILNFCGFVACAAMMAYALYAEHILYLMPCPLCVFQRMSVIAMGFVFLAAALHSPAATGHYVYAGLIALAAIAGTVVAGRHVWLQNMPEEQVPACGPGFDYIMDSFPFTDALKLIFSGSGECADVDWLFLGLSMPTWVLVSIVVLGAFGIWNNVRLAAQ